MFLFYSITLSSCNYKWEYSWRSVLSDCLITVQSEKYNTVPRRIWKFNEVIFVLKYRNLVFGLCQRFRYVNLSFSTFLFLLSPKKCMYLLFSCRDLFTYLLKNLRTTHRTPKKRLTFERWYYIIKSHLHKALLFIFSQTSKDIFLFWANFFYHQCYTW